MPDNTQRLTSSSAPLSSRGSEPDDMRRYLMVIRTFHRPRGMNLAVSRWCWSFGADHFQNFCRFFHCRCPETFKSSYTRNSSLLGRDDRVQWRREVSWFFNFVASKTLKFVDASYALSFLSEWQVPLVGILTGRMVLRSNEISVLSLLRFYLQ